MSGPWECDGGPIENGSGQIVECDSDPCPEEEECLCDAEPPATIDVEFTGVAALGTPQCVDCLDYNSTVYTLNNTSSCFWEGAGECGHTIDLRVLPHPSLPGVTQIFLRVLDVDGETPIGSFFLNVESETIDCTATHELATTGSSGIGCDWGSASATIN